MKEETIDSLGVRRLMREAWNRDGGGREATVGMIKLVALNIKGTGLLSP